MIALPSGLVKRAYPSGKTAANRGSWPVPLPHDLEDSCGTALCSQEHRNRTPRAGRDVAGGTREPGAWALDVSQAEGGRQ